MYSLRDVFSLEELEEWAEHMAAETDVPDDELPMTAEVKIDGLAIALTYEDGVLTRAVQFLFINQEKSFQKSRLLSKKNVP